MNLQITEVIDQLISDCGALETTLQRLSHAAAMPFVKWELRGQIERVESMMRALQQLFSGLRTETGRG